jgi:Flp pilus assembly protein TadD
MTTNVASARPEPEAPWFRVLVAVGAILLFRWAVLGEVSKSTSEEAAAEAKLRAAADRWQTAAREGRHADALAALEELTTLNPRNHVYWWERAGESRTLGRFDDEASALESFVKVAPLPREACPRLPLLYQRLGRKGEAVDALERCVTFAPDDKEVAYYLGYAYERQGQLDRAFATYRQALAHGENGDVRTGLARVLLRKGEPADAYETVSPVLARKPDDVDALLVAGMALTRLGKLAEAKRTLERGAALRPSDPDLHIALAMLAESRGDSAAARTSCDAALRLDPDNKDAKALRARLGGRR